MHTISDRICNIKAAAIVFIKRCKGTEKLEDRDGVDLFFPVYGFILSKILKLYVFHLIKEKIRISTSGSTLQVRNGGLNFIISFSCSICMRRE